MPRPKRKVIKRRRPYDGPTDILTEKISQAMSSGMPYVLACGAFGVPSPTADKWKTEGNLALIKYKIDVSADISVKDKLIRAKVPVYMHKYVEFVLALSRARAISAATHVNNINKVALGGTPVKTLRKRIYKEMVNPITGQLQSQMVQEVEETILQAPNWQASAFMLTHGASRGEFYTKKAQDADIGMGIGGSADTNSPYENVGAGMGAGGIGASGPGTTINVPAFSVILEEQPRLSASTGMGAGAKVINSEDGTPVQAGTDRNGHTNPDSLPYANADNMNGSANPSANHSPHKNARLTTPHVNLAMQGASEYYDPELAKVMRRENGYAAPAENEVRKAVIDELLSKPDKVEVDEKGKPKLVQPVKKKVKEW